MTFTYWEIDCIESSFRNIKHSNEGNNRDIQIIISSIVISKNAHINARAEIVNNYLQNRCRVNNWLFMDNCNIKRRHLKDTVHLNTEGESIFEKNIERMLKEYCFKQI